MVPQQHLNLTTRPGGMREAPFIKKKGKPKYKHIKSRYRHVHRNTHVKRHANALVNFVVGINTHMKANMNMGQYDASWYDTNMIMNTNMAMRMDMN